MSAIRLLFEKHQIVIKRMKPITQLYIYNIYACGLIGGLGGIIVSSDVLDHDLNYSTNLGPKIPLSERFIKSNFIDKITLSFHVGYIYTSRAILCTTMGLMIGTVSPIVIPVFLCSRK